MYRLLRNFRRENRQMELIKKHYKLILCCIPVLSFLLHLHVFGLDLLGIHVWRQTETQTVINNFYREDFNIFHPRVNGPADTDRLHRFEFPLMQWLFALFHRLFGGSVAITRILTFITGLGSMFGIFYLSNKVFNNKALATIAAWCFSWSPVFYYYTVNPLPDNMAMCCAIWSIGLFCNYMVTGKFSYLVWSAVMLLLATLVKLPFVLYGGFMLSHVVLQFSRKEITAKLLLAIAGLFTVCLLPAFAWYITVIPHWENGVVKGALETKQNVAELLEILLRTVTSLLPELLINYGSVLLVLAGFFFLFKNKKQHSRSFPLFLSLSVLIVLYYLYEMNMITTVHDYYLFPFLPLIFLLTGYGGYYLLMSGSRFLRVLTIICLAILPLTAFLRADPRWDTNDPGFNPVYFAYEKQLRSITPSDALCIVGNDPSRYILLYYINRKGWAFDNDELTGQQLGYDISKGAKYLFLDSHIDDNPGIKAHLDEKIFEKGSLRVYKLK